MPPPDVQPAELSTRVSTLHSSPTSDVYVASRDGAPCVVKRTKITSPGDMKRFDRELELLSACDHESVLRPLGVLRAPPTYALVLPVYERGSLFRELHASGRALSTPAKLSIACDLATALAHLHTRGIVHRDVKSDNVRLDPPAAPSPPISTRVPSPLPCAERHPGAPQRQRPGRPCRLQRRRVGGGDHVGHCDAGPTNGRLLQAVRRRHAAVHGARAAALRARRGVRTAVRRVLVRYRARQA